MSKCIILQNVGHEGPGRITPIFSDFGIRVEVRHLYRGDEVPTDFDELRALVILGGPMAVADIGKTEYPFLADEVSLLERMVREDRAVLGICLGAQLLAHVGGGRVYPNARPGATPDAATIPAPEIGFAPVKFPFPGGTEPIVMGAADGTPMFHWHFDTFDLPKLPAPVPIAPNVPPPPTGNSLLSSTAVCKNQAFRFKTRLFGFQYHPEMTRDGIELMLSHARPDAEKVLGPGAVELIREQTRTYYDRYERLGNRILRNFVQFLKLYAAD